MLLIAGAKWGLKFKVLDPDPNAPCKGIAHCFQCGNLQDENTLKSFAIDCKTLTIEVENLNAKVFAVGKDLRRTAKGGAAQAAENPLPFALVEGISRLYPSAEHIALSQDKGHQKNWLIKHGLPTAAYHLIKDKKPLLAHDHFYPCIQKLRVAGYDGRGVQVLNGVLDAGARGFEAPSLIEEKVDIHQELAVIVARDIQGSLAVFSPVEMVFHPTKHLLDYLLYPPDLSPSLLKEIKALSLSLVSQLKVVGLVAIEFFLTKKGTLLVNEFALRPHNSGHHTIEAAPCSQYEQLLRILLHYPLGESACHVPAVACMNLLGHPDVQPKAPDFSHLKEKLLDKPNIFIYHYEKELVKPFRKMGHITQLGNSRSELEKQVKALLAYRWIA